MKKNEIKGLWIPIVTPMYKGSYDSESMSKLIAFVDPYMDGYVPCLSTGEGAFLSDKLWEEVISDLRSKTKKPIIAGIKGRELSEILKLADKAKALGCQAIIVPAPSNNEEESLNFFSKLATKSSLPIMIYNTETAHFKTVEAIQKLDQIENIISLKDSSMNIDFFQKMVGLRKAGSLHMTILQGIEHKLLDSKGCDGFLTSLLNNEPELCKKMFESYPEKLQQQIMSEFWWQHNLGGEWFITLKAMLYSKGILRSAEQVSQVVKL
ncbi:MAG: hypothetical protein A2831_03640 [Candidatus Yanofskybacteria bacterium RIFCSPHIGHO2_01_FULL_44_17]|uniref:Dihydrodipicolinate synthase family protein n=1 Tax=Candidatus Yanofskybacteria bacterium RIFCSPHIGHO2_01_FULL_44_17 TaxID=1802668 RepID=A0A1F8EXZ3_9BACT|nr:MAG: hypothetical protein A2831_03640 [Candidatus Yanofskybacteria bacterium RIFCSPHIGHO2_01_FULL_44_17]